MKIMVFDVPAEIGGALTILKQYYCRAIKDKNTEWIFVVSTPQLIEHTNIKVLKYPWVKRSWVHRLYFDRCIAHRLVRTYEVDEVLSLQNVIFPRVKVRQTLYLHQPLPFIEKRYSINENFKIWVYQNIISRIIFKSLRNADKIIVQTKWIMNAAMKKANVEKSKFLLEQPRLNIQVKNEYDENKENIKLFFYPASGLIYKNHKIIVQASSILKSQGIENYKAVFTLKGDENKQIKKLREIVITENLPIEFIGGIDIDEVYKYYSKSTLIFPSYIETYGLPLLEAKMHKSPIIASNCAFSHEVLDGYYNVDYFDPHNVDGLVALIFEKVAG